MKVGFPLMKENVNIMVDDFYGSDCIGSYDRNTKSFISLSIGDLMEKSGHSDLVSVFKAMDIHQLVCRSIKPGTLKFFSDHHIDVYQAQSDKVELNIELLLDGQLIRFLPSMAAQLSCGTSCSSCESGSCPQ